MDNTPYNSLVPFCTLRQAFRFNQSSDAKAFLKEFGATLLLEDKIVSDEDGYLWLTVEQLEDYTGD